MSQTTYKAFLVILVISLSMAEVELSFVCSVLIAILCFKNKFSKRLAVVVCLLFVLVLIGCFNIFYYQGLFYDYLRDLIYYLRPITVLIAAYLIVINIKDKKSFFNILVIMGFVFAMLHLLRILVHLGDFSFDITYIRNEYGRYNHVELIALVILFCIKDIGVKKSRFKIFYKFFLFCLIFSFILYFSRTMLLVLVLMVLGYRGYLKLNQKGVVALFLGLIFVSGFVLFLNQYEPSGKTSGIGTFLLKMKNSYNEVFQTIDPYKIDKDKRSLWKQWRAYEAKIAIIEIEKNNAWLFGKNFGSKIDLGFEVFLQKKWVQYIPLIHNGFVYVLLKTGILGLIFYFIYILYLYFYYYTKNKKEEKNIYNKMLVACGFYIIVSSIVITGIFKPYDMSSLLVGGLFALNHRIDIENRNNRNKGNT